MIYSLHYKDAPPGPSTQAEQLERAKAKAEGVKATPTEAKAEATEAKATPSRKTAKK